MVLKIFFICIKWSRLADHLKTRQKCLVFEWLKQDSRPFNNRTQIVFEKWPFNYRFVQISNGYCKWCLLDTRAEIHQALLSHLAYGQYQAILIKSKLKIFFYFKIDLFVTGNITSNWFLKKLSSSFYIKYLISDIDTWLERDY
jgi:hypothetical protein